MANYKKPAIVIGLLAAIGAITAFAAPAFSQKDATAGELKAFGISNEDLVYPFKRQAAWEELEDGRYAATPSRPNLAFKDYAISFDETSKRVCAVYAKTSSDAAIDKLKTDLQARYGAPSPHSAITQRWVSDKDFVEITENSDAYYVSWDFTGNCIASAKAR